MRIRDILKVKGGTIHSIPRHGPLAAAVELMVRHDVGSLVVMDGGRMQGMLTFREVLRAFATAPDPGRVTAGEVMVADPVCGTPDDTIDELRAVMTEHHVRYLPVKDGDALVGVVSFHDAARAIIRETSLENRLLRRYIEAEPADAGTP